MLSFIAQGVLKVVGDATLYFAMGVEWLLGSGLDGVGEVPQSLVESPRTVSKHLAADANIF